MGALSRADNATLYAYVNNDDGTLLAEEAKRELAARGLLPEWASAPRSRPMPDNVQGNLDAAAAPINDDPVLVPGMRRGVSGPRRDDGTDPAPAPEFATQAEAERYYTRPTDPTTGMLTASPADAAMAQRGFVPVYGAAGEIGYQIGFPAGEPPASARTNRERQHYERKVIIDPRTNKPALAYDVVSQDGPTGTMDVLAPTDALRAAEANRAEQKMMERLYAQAGLPIPVGQSGKQYTADELRALGRNRREAEAAQRRQAVVRTRQAQTNPLEYLGRSDVSDWQRMAVAERYLRSPQELTPLSVQAANNAQLTQLGLRVATGQGFQQPLPGQQELMQQKIDAGKPTQVLAQEQAAAGRLNHPDVMQHANSIVDRLYSRVTFMGNTSDFTDNEVDLATQKLADDLGIDYESAKPIMQRIQEERRQNMLASGVVAGFYDR